MALRRRASRKSREGKTATQKLFLVRSGPLVPKLVKVTGITKNRYGLPLEAFCALKFVDTAKVPYKQGKNTTKKCNMWDNKMEILFVFHTPCILFLFPSFSLIYSGASILCFLF